MNEPSVRQRLAAILAADVAGFSHLMARDEPATVSALDAARNVFRTQIEANQGRVIDMAGDSVLAAFETAAGAVSAALAIQKILAVAATSVAQDRRMRFRIGLHLGDVIEKHDGSIYGDGVNVAARLEGLAQPGGISVSEAVHGVVVGRVEAIFIDQGEQHFKNITRPIRAFAIKVVDAVAAEDALLDVGAAHGRTRADAQSKTNLPLSRAALFGRGADVSLLASLLASNRLVTVVGAGGIGKSRLAQAVAEAEVGRLRDGAWWIELAGLADAALLPHTVAQQLGLSVPEPAAGLQVLVDALARREMLLVLDNCEHLLEPVALLVDRLLQAAPALRVLATSQEPLHVQSEQQYRLEPLAVPRDASVPGARDYGALVLFDARVRAVAPRFELADTDLPLAIDLCRELDGLPLAIELAAARVPLLGLRTLHAHIRERFRLLTAGARTALRRHQTLRAAMDWSHSLLSEPQRSVFRRLGAFSGGFTMGLAQAVCTDAEQDEWAVIEQLSSLVDKSLVAVDACEPVRYRLLESPRAFAIEQLDAAGEMAGFLARHAATMLQFLRRADDGNMDSTLRSDEYAALVLPELDNLRAAYAWAAGEEGDAAVATGLAAHAGPLIDYSSEFAEWLLARRPHLRPGAVDDATDARFWRAMAATNMQGTLTISERLEAARLATGAYRTLRRPRRLFSALRMVAVWSHLAGNIEGARAAIDEAAALIEPDWPAEFRIVVLRFRAWTSRHEGAYDAAVAMYREALRLAHEVGDWRLEVIERGNVCDLLWQFGRHDEAARSLAESIKLQRLRPVSDFELVEALSMQIGVLGEIGRIEEAAAVARGALPVMRRMPKFRFEPCAQLLWRLGRPEAAARVLGAQAARERDGREMSQGNEKRIAQAMLASLQAELGPAQLAAEMALGDQLRHIDVCSLLADGLAGAATYGSDKAAVRLDRE